MQDENLQATRELRPLLDEVLAATMELQDADSGSVQLYNPKSRALEIVAHRGVHQDFLDHFNSVREAGAFFGRTLRRAERVIIEDVLADPEFEPHRPVAVIAGIRAIQCAPLFSLWFGIATSARRSQPRDPIVFIAATASDDEQERRMTAGAVAFLRKPGRLGADGDTRSLRARPHPASLG